MKNNIGEARRSYGNTLPSGKFTQDEAAAAFGVSPSTYKKWEQGQGMLNGEILCMIADKYNCSVEYLLCRTDIPGFEEVRIKPRPLTKNEKELIDLFRSLPEKGRHAVLVGLRDYAGGNR